MSANDPLTSNINALITLANSATGESDTNLSDAVHTLIDGYGGSSWTKVCEKTYENISGTTSLTVVETWETGHPEIWTSDKILCVIMTDTAGKRNGYFYQSYTFFLNISPYNGPNGTTWGRCTHFIISYNNDAFSTYQSVDTGTIGVAADTVYSTGNIRITQRYNSTNSRTIDGNYKAEVFLLDTHNGLPLFGSDTNTGGDSGGDSGNSGLILTWYDPEVVA